jgi:transcriptional regulator with XRE-family HTH domain
MNNLAQYLRDSRTRRGLTLAFLADVTDLSISYLSDLEHGRADPSLKTLRALASLYGMGAGDLLVEAGESVHYNAAAERLAQARALARHCLERAIAEVAEFGEDSDA